MDAAFDDEPNYFLRGSILVAVGITAFFGLTWVQGAGINAVDSSKAAQVLFGVRIAYFTGALFILLGFVSWIRGLMSVVVHLNSCLVTVTLGAMVLLVITGIILFIEYRPDQAAQRVADRHASEDLKIDLENLSEMRTFTSADGRTMEAVFISFDGKKVKILRSDGRVFTNSIELYSAEDWEFIQKQKPK